MAELVSIREEGKVTVVEILSELDRLSVLSIKNQITELTKQKRKQFIINFSNIDHINSTIVGALVGIRDFLRKHGGDLVLCGVSPDIHRTLDLIGASQILRIYDTETDALEEI